MVLSTFDLSQVTLYSSATLEPYCILSTAVSVNSYAVSHLSIDLNEPDSVCISVYKCGRLLTMGPAAGTDYAFNP